MKLLRVTSTFLILFLVHNTFGQSRYNWRTEVDQIIQNIDSLSLKSQETFFARNIVRVDRSFKNDIEVKETWHYTMNRGQIVYCEVRYLIDSTEYIEAYYVHDNRLVCMENYATEFYNPTANNFVAGEVLFYVDDVVKLHVSTGKNRDPLVSWRLERRPFEKFLDRYTSLKRSLRDVSLNTR